MPMAIPLLAAAGTAAAGWAGASALLAGTVTATSVMGGLMVAGAAMTAVGALTGNKKLLNLGSVVSLVGGVGSLASSLTSAASSASSVAGDVAMQAAADTALAGSGNFYAGAAGAASEAANQSVLAGMQGFGGTDIVGGIPTPSVQPGMQAIDKAAAGGLIDSAGAQAAAGPAGVESALTQAEPGWQSVVSPQAAQPTGLVDRVAGASDSTNLMSTLKDKAQGAADWMKRNPELTKLGSGIIQGGAQVYSQMAAADMAAQRERDNRAWAQQRYSDSVRGLTLPFQVRNGAAPAAPTTTRTA